MFLLYINKKPKKKLGGTKKMKIIKILISFILGFATSFILIIYSLQIVNIETTESGAMVTIKLLNAYENYYIKK